VRVGTTQSVISRLESDDYEGHSLSMLVRIGAALDRRIAVTATGEGEIDLAVRERAPQYEADRGVSAASPGTADADPEATPQQGLSFAEFDRLADRIAERFADRGITKADVDDAIRWARGQTPGRSVAELRGAIAVGPGDVVEDVRRARARRGRERGNPSEAAGSESDAANADEKSRLTKRRRVARTKRPAPQ
jgi:hypothetical protein